jgi:glycosyltransferase involved in cell wall biosynthesis
MKPDLRFTVILNSRGRVEQLRRFVEIMEAQTMNHSQVEMIIKADDDDIDTITFLEELKGRVNSFHYNPIISPRPKSLCGSYNVMAKMARGQYILVMNDDAEMTTKNWDEIAWNCIHEYKAANHIIDDIVYVDTNDTSVDKISQEYSSFPIISKQAVDVLGFFMYDVFVGHGGDHSIYRLWQKVGRIVKCKQILVDHIYHNALFKIFMPDQTQQEVRINSNTKENHVDAGTFNVDKEAQILIDFIKNYGQ